MFHVLISLGYKTFSSEKIATKDMDFAWVVFILHGIIFKHCHFHFLCNFCMLMKMAVFQEIIIE